MLCVVLLVGAMGGRAQQKGTPGVFDFYLLNLAWSADFCHIKDVGAGCVAPPTGFVLHGLWAQNSDGTYPVFCDETRPGPAHPERNLDLTPDLTLLGHEWAKHGTCTMLAADAFFAAERKAYRGLVVPPVLARLDHEIERTPAEVLAMFTKVNPEFPASTLVVWCSERRLTSVSACLTKDLRPTACKGLKSCAEAMVKIAPPSAGAKARGGGGA